MRTMSVHPDKIRDVIGKGGVTIRSITEETGTTIDIDDDGIFTISRAVRKNMDTATRTKIVRRKRTLAVFLQVAVPAKQRKLRRWHFLQKRAAFAAKAAVAVNDVVQACFRPEPHRFAMARAISLHVPSLSAGHIICNAAHDTLVATAVNKSNTPTSLCLSGRR